MKTLFRKVALPLLFTLMLPVQPALQAQSDSRPQHSSGQSERPESWDDSGFFNGYYRHRFTVAGGGGLVRSLHPLTEESGPAWMMNSLIFPQSGHSMVLPISGAAESRLTSARTFFSYSYVDRIDINYRRNTMRERFGRDNSPTTMLLYPENASYVTSLFEGTRIMRTGYDHRIAELAYYHPILDNLLVGLIVGHHTLRDDNIITLGSYTLSKSTPSRETWSMGGDVRMLYEMDGILPGIGVKWDILDWLRLNYSGYLLKRSGSLQGAGVQLVETKTRDGSTYSGYGIWKNGAAEDSGMLHRLELELRRCRWSMRLGYEREDYTRSHSMLNSLPFDPHQDVSLKGRVIGLGEMMTDTSVYRHEAYLMVGVSAHFGRTGRAAVRRDTEGAAAAGEARVAGDNLDKVYERVRDELRKSGEPLEELADQLSTTGFNFRKIKDENGNTTELLAAVDGDLAFATGSAELTQAAIDLIDRVSVAMTENPNISARIHGHTDTPGTRAGNLRLSQRRAEAVRDGMVRRHSIAARRFLEVKGFADDHKLVDTNASEPRNRRTDIRFAYQEGL